MIAVVVAARGYAAGDFRPASAATIASPLATVEPTEAPLPTIFASPAATTEPAATVATAIVEAQATPEATVAAATPSLPPAPRPAPATATPEPPRPTAAPTATAATCAAGAWFCYPRVGISGAIVPYTDCSGSTDVGSQIRSFNCLSDHYLMAHAYTQFGRITGWQQGDVVFAYGRSYTVTGAIVARSCEAPPLPLAPLSMQTSLTTSACGAVLIVQAR